MNASTLTRVAVDNRNSLAPIRWLILVVLLSLALATWAATPASVVIVGPWSGFADSCNGDGWPVVDTTFTNSIYPDARHDMNLSAPGYPTHMYVGQGLPRDGGTQFTYAIGHHDYWGFTPAANTLLTATINTYPSWDSEAQPIYRSSITWNCTTGEVMSIVNTDLTLFTVGGTLSGLNGGSVVLQNNGGDDLTLSTDGPFQFSIPVDSGSAYSVSVLTQPTSPAAQTCTVDSTTAAGTIDSADVTDVAVSCTTTNTPPVTPVPTLSEWGLMLLGLLAAGLGVRQVRRRI